jgi:hypothetical protein
MCTVNELNSVMDIPTVPLAEACCSVEPFITTATTEFTFGTYHPHSPEPTSEVVELREKVAYLTNQLVGRERVLQAEKDEFIASVSRASTTRIVKVQEELEASKNEIIQLRKAVAAAKDAALAAASAAAAAAAEAAVKAAAEAAAVAAVRDLRPPTLGGQEWEACAGGDSTQHLPKTPRRDDEPSPAEEEMRRRVADLETRLTASREECESSRETVHARDDEIKKLSETAKRLSNALRKRTGETEMLKKDFADEQAFSQGLAANKAALEEQIEEFHKVMTAVIHERNDAARDARLMAHELQTLQPVAIELEVWHVWIDTEIRGMTAIGKELGNEVRGLRPWGAAPPTPPPAVVCTTLRSKVD